MGWRQQCWKAHSQRNLGDWAGIEYEALQQSCTLMSLACLVPARRGGDVVVARFRRRRQPLSVQEGYWVVTEGTLHSTAQHCTALHSTCLARRKEVTMR
jgi:hypothetical protein